MVTILIIPLITLYFFCGDNPGTALISMKSTQLKVSRKWNSMMMGIKMQGKKRFIYTAYLQPHLQSKDCPDV
jgi:hypothetical protein